MTADEMNDWLDQIEPDPKDARDAAHFRRIVAAAEAVDAASGELEDAVAAARAAGDTWAMIGAALGVSEKAALDQFDTERISGAQPATTGDVRMGGTQYFAKDHLQMAKSLAAACLRREQECVQNGVTGPDTEAGAYALAAIVESAAFLEAAVNELWHDVVFWRQPKNCPYLVGLEQQSIDLLHALIKKGRVDRSLGTLEKYDLTLLCAGKNKLIVGRSPGQDVKSILRARNALVHFKPELVWADHPDDDRYTEHDLEQAIKPRVPANPLMTNMGPWFPYHLLCAGVARWAWEKSAELAEEWRLSLGLELDYQRRGSRTFSWDGVADDET